MSVAWSLLTSRIAGPVAAGLALILAVALGVTTLQRNAAVRERDALHAEIHAPVTGYIARQARCEANGRALDAALQRQSAAVEDLRREGAERLAAAETRLAAAQHAAADARLRAERLLNVPLTTTDRCERFEEADARVLEALR